MVTAADGAAQLDGVSRGLSGPGDKRIFHLLRELADVILVGQNTVLRETYVPVRPSEEFAAARAANGQEPAPAVAVVCDDPARFDYRTPLFTEARPRTVLISTRRASAGSAWAAAERAADTVVASAPGHDDQVDLRQALAALSGRGRTRVLCEGGPVLLTRLAASGLLDELCLTYAPRLTAGPAKRVTDGPVLRPLLDLDLVGLLEEDGFLFARYQIRRGGQAAEGPDGPEPAALPDR
jgi:riboflavin biosynthesis pyrimidine reductase